MENLQKGIPYGSTEIIDLSRGRGKLDALRVFGNLADGFISQRYTEIALIMSRRAQRCVLKALPQAC